jgi:hypothetical protein
MANLVNPAQLNNSIDAFLRQCDSTIGTLTWALGQEIDDGETGLISNIANRSATTAVNNLEAQAHQVNALIAQNRALLQNCPHQRLDGNFSGDQIQQAENNEWSLLNMISPIHGKFASMNTAVTINNTLARIREVEAQALAMHNHINPNDQRGAPCCREFWVCFNPAMRCIGSLLLALCQKDEDKKKC